jgi:hypothetical protein
MLWETGTETWDSEMRKQGFILPAQMPVECPKLSPENKGVLPYVPLQASYRGNKIKTRFNPYMVICNWIGYFTLVLVPFYPYCYVTFTIGFFRFYLSAMPSLPPCYSIRTQVCLFLFWSSSLLKYNLGSIIESPIVFVRK